ncbi:MAG: DNA-binding response regulator [Phycisphaeraceae bacterium]|nr:MAG: DNA-binding response regulator [Phycisphaeraceae bacterium]
MSNYVRDGDRRLNLAAELTESICALPAIATLRWCDTAAEAFTQLHPQAVVAVTVAEISANGQLLNVEAAGAASTDVEAHRLESIRRRFISSSSLGWSPGDAQEWQGATALRIGGPEADQQWAGAGPLRAWAEHGVSHMLAGGARLTSDVANRVVIVECGARSTTAPFVAEDAALLRSTLPPLANRVRRAFGDVANEESNFLTPREQQVLDMLSLGMSVKQIAADLMRSPHTVHDHVKSLHRKLNASSRGELIARALGHVSLPKIQNGDGRISLPKGQNGDGHISLPKGQSGNRYEPLTIA